MPSVPFDAGSGSSHRSRYSKATTPVPLLTMSGHNGHQPRQAQSQSSGMRTPGAWHLRDVNLARPGQSVRPVPQYTSAPSHHHQRYPPAGHNGHQQQRPSSPSATTTEGDSDDREEVPMVRTSRRANSHVRGHSADRRSVMSRGSRLNYHGHQVPINMAPYDLVSYGPSAYHHHHGLTNGTLRSSRSVPALNVAAGYDTADCPMHGQGTPGAFHSMGPVYNGGHEAAFRRFGSMVDMRSLPQTGPAGQPFNYSMVNYMPDKKFNQYSNYPGIMTLPRQPVFHRPMAQYVDMSGHREAYKMMATQAGHSKLLNKQHFMYEETNCCRGHLIVLWIILAVVLVGVVSGIVLAVTMS
ncbi:hypothetical protein HDE_11939 [Halotydeus destructor]|nr:hypothetical protein HDE_11939 [Halotydeus destructor]